VIDLTDLITTIISSTAALVAIIGGFLVSRVITLSSEKNAITRRLGEINAELDSKINMYDNIGLLLLESDVDDFFHEYAEDILIYEKPIQEILDEEDSADLTEDELKPYIEMLLTIYNHVIDMIDNTDDDYSLPRSFDDFVKDNEVSLNDNKDWYELVYNTIYKEFQRDLQRQASSNPLLGFHPLIRVPDPAIYNFRSISNAKWYGDKIKERNILKDELQILTVMKEEQKKTLSNYGQISGIWSGLAVLAYSSIAGIVIPILLLPYPLNTYDDAVTRKVLLVLFFSHLIILFIYLAVSMYKLTKED
jgi:hypothetical protein